MSIISNHRTVFITGGARSGKSSFALSRSSLHNGGKAFIATAQALDDEMKERIETHKKQRGGAWVTFEEPLRIADTIREIRGKFSFMVVDCLTLWLCNILHSSLDASTAIEDLNAALRENRSSFHSEIAIVGNEVGFGIVPENELARKFRDTAGFLNQLIAKEADEVYMVVSGIPLRIK